ncbi:MAG: carboxymuconolactone decarboxylase family protein [Gammaproteobacteria bacterium]|jgi:AhpD family alkylhydroperoxidase
MRPQLNYTEIAPEGLQPMHGLEAYIRQCGLEHSLLELVKTRASQINGCAFCLDMHTKDARAAGETEQRLYTLPAWRETPFFSARERAALLWTETLTELSTHEITEQIEQTVQEQFSDRELVDLTLAIIVINGWNRLAIPFHTPAGSYDPATWPRRTKLKSHYQQAS